MKYNNIETHPEFGTAMDEAGVEIRFLPCHVEPDEMRIKQPCLFDPEKI